MSWVRELEVELLAPWAPHSPPARRSILVSTERSDGLVTAREVLDAVYPHLLDSPVKCGTTFRARQAFPAGADAQRGWVVFVALGRIGLWRAYAEGSLADELSLVPSWIS